MVEGRIAWLRNAAIQCLKRRGFLDSLIVEGLMPKSTNDRLRLFFSLSAVDIFGPPSGFVASMVRWYQVE